MKACPFDVSLDKLVSGPMGDRRIVATTRAQMHNVLNTCRLGIVQQSFALSQHVYGITRENEKTVNVRKAAG